MNIRPPNKVRSISNAEKGVGVTNDRAERDSSEGDFPIQSFELSPSMPDGSFAMYDRLGAPANTDCKWAALNSL